MGLHRPTVDAYDGAAADYERNRNERDPDQVRAFAAAVERVAGVGGRRLDLGCGPGLCLPALGSPAVGLDASAAMVRLARTAVAGTPVVQADLAALPFRPAAFAGVWASKSLQHVAHADLPLALHDVRRVLPVGGRLGLRLFAGHGTFTSDDDLPGRRFSLWSPGQVADLLEGAGFTVDELDVVPAGPTRLDRIEGRIDVTATRARSLADTVGPGMRLLVSGLNPSLHAADAGIGYVTPGNRFWPALLDAGLATVDRDPLDLLRSHRIGLTDLVKRATPRAAELSAAEYRGGLDRLERLCAWLQPGAVCFVGLAGWRAAADRTARPGWQDRTLGGVPVYVMPSTSGLNARVPRSELSEHLANAAESRP